MNSLYDACVLDVIHPDQLPYNHVDGLHHFSIVASIREGEYYPLDTNTEVFASLAVSINLALEMLETESGRQALCELGYFFVTSEARHPYGIAFSGDLSMMNEYVSHFLERVRNRHPLVGVQKESDHVIASTSPGCRSTSLNNFNPEDAGMITYNLERVNAMVVAHDSTMRATRPRDKMFYEERWRSYVFIFACATIHELAGLFTAYLSLGQVDSPRFDSEPRRIGGRWLEWKLYGGSLEIYKSKTHAPNDPGMLFLVDENNQASRINPLAVINFVMNPEQYQRPLSSIGQRMTPQEIRVLDMQLVGSTTTHGIPLPHNVRVMQSLAAWPELLRYSISIEDLRQRSSLASAEVRAVRAR